MATLNFPEVWLDRVIEKLTSADQAPWLDGIAELDGEVIEMGAGGSSEKNVIHIPASTFEPDVLVNNTNDLDVQAFSDDEVVLSLDKYQTKATSLYDDQVIGAAYDRIDGATRSHVTAILKKKYSRAIWNLAPDQDAAGTPVINTTGTASTGMRKPLVYADLVSLKAAFDAMDCPEDGRRLVLCSDHVNDLLLDRANFGDLILDYNAGKPAPVVAGFRIYSYIANPYYVISTNKRHPFGSAVGGTERQASIAFYEENVAKKTGLTKQYYQPAEIDPVKQRNLLNYRHYFLAAPMRSKYMGAILSKNG